MSETPPATGASRPTLHDKSAMRPAEPLAVPCNLCGELEDYEVAFPPLTGDRFMYNVGVMSKSQPVISALNGLSRRLHLSELSLTVNLMNIQRISLVEKASRRR